MAMSGSQAVLDGVRDLLPSLRERADEAERLRVVPEASIKEIEETGFFRLLQPKRFDGLEADPVDFYTAVRDIAGACGSTGWVCSVVGVHPWQVALFADEAQQAVWGSDPATRLSSSYAPTGKAVLTDGPYAETKELLGGYHLIECKDRDEAVAIARRIPTLPVGGVVEVRPVLETE